MSRNHYKLWAFGPPVGLGATGAVHIAMAGVAKKATAAQPFIVANEIVCNGLARALLLPCPPGALVHHVGETYFFALDFNVAGQSLPPASAAALIEFDPSLAWLIILFDILIMNADRHPQNIAFDRTNSSTQIFDHSHAFVGPSGDAEANLVAKSDLLAIGGHCLASEINTAFGFSEACSKIKSLPNFFLDGVSEQGCEVGIPAECAGKCASVLKARRDKIDKLIMGNIGAFRNLPVGSL